MEGEGSPISYRTRSITSLTFSRFSPFLPFFGRTEGKGRGLGIWDAPFTLSHPNWKSSYADAAYPTKRTWRLSEVLQDKRSILILRETRGCTKVARERGFTFIIFYFLPIRARDACSSRWPSLSFLLLIAPRPPRVLPSSRRRDHCHLRRGRVLAVRAPLRSRPWEAPVGRVVRMLHLDLPPLVQRHPVAEEAARWQLLAAQLPLPSTSVKPVCIALSSSLSGRRRKESKNVPWRARDRGSDQRRIRTVMCLRR